MSLHDQSNPWDTIDPNHAVLHGSVHVYLIFYGEWNYDGTLAGYTDPRINLLQNFIGDLNGSSWIAPVASYYDAAGAAATNLYFAGAIFDGAGNGTPTPGSQGNTLNNTTIINVLKRALTTTSDVRMDYSHTQLPTEDNAIYVIVGHHEVVANLEGETYGGSSATHCGVHYNSKYFDTTSANASYSSSWTLINNTNVKFIYVADPDTSSSLCEFFYSAGQPTPNGDKGGDALTNILAHELVESITDPVFYSVDDQNNYPYPTLEFGGWQDNTNQAEIADYCMQLPYPNTHYINNNTNNAPYTLNVGSHYYFLQGIYQAVGGPCIY